MDEKFNQNKYIADYKREHYAQIKVSIPKGKREILTTVAELKGKSINRLFIEAFEKTYGVDLTIVEEQLK